ncbi:SprB repeat-containing protein, partial [Flavobacterium sp. SaA2.13]
MKTYKRIILLLMIALTGLSAHAQLYVSDGGSDNFVVSNSGLVYVDGALTTDGKLTNMGTIEVTGDVTNNDEIDGNSYSGTLILKGTATQTIGGSESLQLNNLTFNNAAGFNLTNFIAVDNTVTFTDGIITSSGMSGILGFATGSSYTGASDASHVNGYVAVQNTGSFDFPVGDGTRLQKINANLATNTSGVIAQYIAADAGAATFATTGSDTNPLISYNDQEAWLLTTFGGMASGTVTVYWDDYNNPAVTGLSLQRVAHKTGGEWLNQGTMGTGTVANGSVTSNSINISANDVFALGAVTPLSATVTNVSCNAESDGSVAISVSATADSYEYILTSGGNPVDSNTSATATQTFSGLTAGSYDLTVNIYDAGSVLIDTYTDTFTVTQPTTLNLTPASQTNIACNGGATGAATVNTATGGAGGYTYNWTPGNPTGDGTTSVSGLSAGTWTCTVTDANGCTASVNFTVTQPTTLNLTPASQTNIACNGGATGAATVNTATGGTPGYTYDWTPGNPTGDGTTSVSGLTAGTWTCTVTDANGCTASV